jgi:iron complex outermembrane receptor protein
MTRRLILAILVSCFIHSYLGAQAVISGRVFDVQTKETLPAANILYGKGQGTVTKTDGSFTIYTEAGTINLMVRFVGYQQLNRLVNVRAGDTLFLELGLIYEISEIDQIVVSAGKVEQRVSELAVSMNVISPARLALSHTADAAELMNKTPGIEVLDGQASVRGGSGFSYGAGSRVLALIDGLPALAADAGNIKWQFMPLENITQVEVIKGASSVLYGSSALNGVINFRTADARTTPVTKFYTEGGIFGKPSNKDWIWWDSPRVFSSASFSHIQKSGNTNIGMGLYLLSDEGYRKFNEEKLGRMNLRIQRDDQKISGLSYGASIIAGLTRKTDFVLWENGWTGALKQDTATANQMKGHLFTLDPFIRFEKKDKYRHDLRTRLQSTNNRFPEGGENDSQAFSFLAEYQARYNFFKWLEISLGGIETYSQIVSAFYGDHTALNLAGYAQADFAPSNKLKLVSGVRVEHNSLNGESDKAVPLFRAGLNYRLRGYTFLRASFGQGYRFPSIAEKYAVTTLGSVRIVPNPAIMPESGWNSEIGVKQGILASEVNGFIDLAAFYTRNTDMIEYLFGVYPVPGEESYSFGFMASNVENSRVYGTELSFSLNRRNGRFQHSLGGGYTFMYPVEFNPVTGENSDTHLKYRRKHSFKLNTNSEIKSFDFGIDISAGSKILNVDDVFLAALTRETILPGFFEYWQKGNDGYVVIDPHLGYSFGEHFRVSLVIKNVLNTEYIGRPGDIMPQRSFSLRFSGEF